MAEIPRPPRLETIDLALAANEERVLQIDADFFDVQEATGLVRVKIEGEAGAKMEKGLGFEVPRQAPGFTRLHIQDLSGAPNTVRIAYGVGAFHDRRTTISGAVSLAGAIPAGANNIGDVDIASIAAGANSIGRLNAPSALVSSADVACNSGMLTDLLAVNAARKYAYISSLAANTGVVKIREAGGGYQGIELQPGQTLVLETTAAIKCSNGSGAVQSMSLAEVNY